MAMTNPAAAQNIIINTLGVVVLMHIMDFFKLQVVEVSLGDPIPKVIIFSYGTASREAAHFNHINKLSLKVKYYWPPMPRHSWPF